jgi:hypothetical protein
MLEALLGPSPSGTASAVVGVSAAVAVAFWAFLAIAVLAGVWLAYARNRETQKTIRLAIEKGMQLDAATIETLVVRKPGKPEDYWIGGIICIATGVGLPILAYFIGRIEPTAFFPIVGAGLLAGLIGISLVVCGIMIGRRRNTQE